MKKNRCAAPLAIVLASVGLGTGIVYGQPPAPTAAPKPALGQESPAPNESALIRQVDDLVLSVLKQANPPGTGLVRRDAHPKMHGLVRAEFIVPSDMPTYKNDINNWGYEAKPLHGIWATAPYLHNGSVTSLAQLLLPAHQRMKTFHVGTHSFDPVNVGYQTDARYGGSLFDTSLPGNRNTGHEYGADLSAADRKYLLEYLKTL